jgi:FtsH-binding integral membrane protein
MNQLESVNPYQSYSTIAAQAVPEERADFIRKTYAHLLGAIVAFVGLEVLYFQSGIADSLTQVMIGGQVSWLVVLGAFLVVSWIANYWAQSTTSLGMQYLGLGAYVVAQSLIFVPLLWIAANFGGADVIPTAGLVTLILFGGLTVAVFTTGKDFSFLGPFLWLAGFAALGLIVCSILIGFSLGMAFTVAMIALACGWILYDTSNVLHHYRIGQHVAASLALFASVALLFWYVLRLFLASRD